MKTHLTNDDIDTLIRVKYGRLVDSTLEPAFITNAKLAKFLGVAPSTISHRISKRIQELKTPSKKYKPIHNRQRFGLKFISEEMRHYIVARETLQC